MAKKINYASLYTLRSDGRYQGHYVDVKGKRHSICDRDPERLYFKIQERENQEANPPKFADIAQAWKYEVMDEMPDGTQASYAAHFKRAVERFGPELIQDISSHDISMHLQFLKAKGLAASTINKQLVIYRSIFQWAIVHEDYGRIIKINPAIAVKLPKGLPKAKQREAPEEDVVNKIQQNATTAYFGLFPMFLLCTGMRRGEALAVRWCDVDFSEGTISVNFSVSLRGSRGVITAPKTDSGIRKVPILPPLARVLAKPENAKNTDYIFHGENPSLPMANSCYQRRWNHYCKEMGFVDGDKHTITAHVLRHGYATMLYEAGIDEKEAAELMGHADEEMLRKVYTHLRNKKRASAADRLKVYTQNGL